MANMLFSQPQQFTGKIVQVLEDKGKNWAKILIKPECIELRIDGMQEVYLLDEIIVECDILVHKIYPKISESNYD